MYIEHPFKYDGVYYAKVDGELIEITREQAKVMLSFYRNYKNYDKKWGYRGEEDNDEENSEQRKKKEKEELDSCKELMDELEQEEKEAEKKAAGAEAVQEKSDKKADGKKEKKGNEPKKRKLVVPREIVLDCVFSEKTESSVRKVFLPRSVAEMMVEWKNAQEERKDILGSEYTDYNLVMAGTFGYPLGDTLIRGALKKLIKEHDLPPVVFHSLRHTSVTYKLKLNGGDVKAVQGDSGHAQVSMVSDVYSHIIDDDRKQNAFLFEDAFYAKKYLDPKIHETGNG